MAAPPPAGAAAPIELSLEDLLAEPDDGMPSMFDNGFTNELFAMGGDDGLDLAPGSPLLGGPGPVSWASQPLQIQPLQPFQAVPGTAAAAAAAAAWGVGGVPGVAAALPPLPGAAGRGRGGGRGRGRGGRGGRGRASSPEKSRTKRMNENLEILRKMARILARQLMGKKDTQADILRVLAPPPRSTGGRRRNSAVGGESARSGEFQDAVKTVLAALEAREERIAARAAGHA